MVRLALVINRTSGRFVRGNDEALARRLTEHPAVADVWDFDVDTIGDRIAAAQDDGYDGIAIAGGDGTIQAVACLAHRTGADCPLLPLPLGTANLLTRRLYGNRSAEDLLDSADTASPQPFRPGLVGEEIFLVAAALGFPSTVARAREVLREADGMPALPSFGRRVAAATRHAFRPRIRYTLDADDEDLKRASGVYVDLDSDDGDMAFIAVHWRNIGDVAWAGFTLLTDIHDGERPGVSGRTTRLDARSRKPIPVMLDGEPVFMPRHVTIERSDEPIRFLNWTE
jgi:diacylglycerol kinase family enzyme